MNLTTAPLGEQELVYTSTDASSLEATFPVVCVPAIHVQCQRIDLVWFDTNRLIADVTEILTPCTLKFIL